jgi:hypothetical protein
MFLNMFVKSKLNKFYFKFCKFEPDFEMFFKFVLANILLLLSS